MMEENKNLDLLRVRDQAISNYIVNGYKIAEDNPNSRQCTLVWGWEAGSIILTILLLCLYIIPGVIYIAIKASKKKVINY